MADIRYNEGVPPLHQKWHELLSIVLNNAGIYNPVYISSTYRDAYSQASAMYDTIQKDGLEATQGHYMNWFNMYHVFDAYKNAPAPTNSVGKIKIMESAIKKYGITGGHMTTDTSSYINIDFPPQPEIDNNLDRFINEVSKVGKLKLPSKGERSYHLVFEGNPDILKNKIFKTPDLPFPHTPRPKKPEAEELSNATIISSNDRVYEELGDGVLQIGDLIFVVDPTQLAFNTQNGYQYFPTLRTQGNPKVPTMNQVKNISINLIFPNEDSINYQLLNLYAMFKRTPFVNIRNKDISAFFKEIIFQDEWLSVALESIQIQSVNGFPNTLQASITLLPFDNKIVSNGFQALKSMRDVQRQQSIIYNNKETELLISKSEAKLHSDPSILDKSSDANISKEINKSPDFRDSLPFRSFYQSLIAERSEVVDNFGNPVTTTEGRPFSLKNFIPIKQENYLHEYKAANNQEPIELEYNYIPADFREVSRILSNERTATQSGILTRLTQLSESLSTPQDITNAMITSFTTEGDLYKLASSRFSLDFDNIVDDQLRKFGITLDNGNEKPIHNVVGLMFRHVLGVTGIGSLVSASRDLLALSKGEISKDLPDYIGFFNGLSFEHSMTLQAGMRDIVKYLNEGTNTKQKKESFAAFLVEMRQTIENELGLISGKESILLTDEGFSVSRLPIQKGKLLIDNKKDIITGWSLIFANKFVPINLLAFKHPYYQHIGSEDPTLSLSITSTSEKEIDFKAKLSELSERLYETVKIVTLTAPELITYLDSRVTINSSINNIFNCFGIKKVIFESSNTVNIEGHPNCWNTTVNLTQANFTIAQYHSISQVPTNEIVRDEISKLLVRIDKNSAGEVTVYKFLHKDSTPCQFTLNDLIRMQFLDKHGVELNDYINKSRSFVANQTTTTTDRGVTRSVAPVDAARIQGVPVSVTRTEVENSLVGKELADKIQDQIYKNTNVIKVVDEDSTNAIRLLMLENPVFKNLLDFLISKTNNLYKSKLSFFQTIIYKDSSLIQNFIKELGAKLGPLGIAAGIGCLVLFFLPTSALLTAAVAGGTITTLAYTAASAAVVTGAGEFGLSAINAASKAIGQEAKDMLLSKFNSIFGLLEQTISSSLAQDFADKVIRDPIVYERLITPEIVGKEVMKVINDKSLSENVNCYGDFDLPILPGLILGPDFYLHNSIIDESKKNDYIKEALKRYAGVGKLCAMMTLVEAKDAVNIYDKLMKRAGDVDDKIRDVIDEMILGTKNNSQTSIDGRKKMLYDQLEAVSLVTKGFDKKLLPTKDLQEAIAETGEYSNLDVRKLNLIKTARMSVMLEIFNVYLSLNNYYREKLNTDLAKPPTDKDGKVIPSNLSKGQSEINSANNLYDILSYFLPNADKITQESLLPADGKISEAGQKKLIEMFEGGMAEVADAKFVSLPGIQNVQNYLVNKIGYFIRLNSFLVQYNTTGGANALAHLDYSLIPELKFLDYWNFRAVDENTRKIQIEKAFDDSFDPKKDTTIKLFPTFKIFFVEEDKNFVTHDFDDYYTQNAIQTIEIITNKNSPGITAVVRLSNVTGALTDRASLLREKEDIAGYGTNKKVENIFFGTLDIKPGTQIIIKMGYAPFDNILTTVFQGRIIEMNPGPMVELICQSFGTQLNHQIVAEKFGFLSSVREHGDVASTILDMIPGLEKLGKMSMWGDTGISTFSGKNIRNSVGKTGDKFLLSNLLGSLSSMMFGIDNPRDENIYLDYSVSNNIWNHPTFDWVVYDQSVWEALREICLYHRNNIVTLRPYNNNGLSTKNDYRETLIVGDKAGYYKDTDAFGLSTLNIKDVNKICLNWKELKDLLKSKNKFINVVPLNKRPINPDLVDASKSGKDYLDAIKISNEGKLLFEFFKDQLSTLVIVAHLLKNNKVTDGSIPDLEKFLTSLIDKKGYIPNSFDELIHLMITFSKEDAGRNILSDTYYNENQPEYHQLKVFDAIIKGLRKRLGDEDLVKEDYYNVKKQVLNNDELLATNPQYKKIQQHHLITDVSDIISNNITLNSNFANVVNVYYTGEPKIKTASLDHLDDNYIQNKLKIWSIKAFGDQRDEFSRPLNSYQKNIDTNWFDTVEKTQNFFKTYKRVKGVDALKKIHNINEAQTNIPCWNIIPSFGVVAVSLLKQETEKMYQGTIEIVGNPNIKPFDIIHLQDYTNDMHGAIEVEEVIHTFTPDRGFRTVITPNLITYDRDPIQMQDVQIINQIYDFSNENFLFKSIGGSAVGLGMIYGSYAGISSTVAAGTAVTLGSVAAAAGGVGLGLLGLSFLYNGVVGSYIKSNKFLYDQMGKIMGRDCINFTSLLYKGVPYMAGFDGVDYTNLKTLMNHNVANIKDPISRYLSFGDTFLANITTGWDPSKYDLLKNLFGGIPIINDVVNITPDKGI